EAPRRGVTPHSGEPAPPTQSRLVFLRVREYSVAALDHGLVAVAVDHLGAAVAVMALVPALVPVAFTDSDLDVGLRELDCRIGGGGRVHRRHRQQQSRSR